jgi:hypothetical protein
MRMQRWVVCLRQRHDDNGQLIQAMLEAQAGRLADASNRVFQLETEIKENAPKVDRLRDYEDKIDQLTKTQQLWWVT